MIRALSILCAAAALVATALASAGPANSAPVSLNRPGWAQTQPWDANDSRQVVGTSSNVDDSVQTACLFNNGNYADIGPAGAQYSAATGISNNGLIVGDYGTADPNAPSQRSFVYENGSYTDFSVASADDTLVRHVSSDGRYLTGTWSDASAASVSPSTGRPTAVPTSSCRTLPSPSSRAARFKASWPAA